MRIYIAATKTCALLSKIDNDGISILHTKLLALFTSIQRSQTTDDIQMHFALKKGFNVEKMKLRKIAKKVVKEIKDINANMTSFKDDIMAMMNQNIAVVEAEVKRENEENVQRFMNVDDRLKQ